MYFCIKQLAFLWGFACFCIQLWCICIAGLLLRVKPLRWVCLLMGLNQSHHQEPYQNPRHRALPTPMNKQNRGITYKHTVHTQMKIHRQFVYLFCLLFFVSMGSRSPASSSQPPAFFSKLTESNSAIVKSKKEMIKKMVVGTEAEFSEFVELNLTRSYMVSERSSYLSVPVSLIDHSQPGTEIFNMPASMNAGEQLHESLQTFASLLYLFANCCFTTSTISSSTRERAQSPATRGRR